MRIHLGQSRDGLGLAATRSPLPAPDSQPRVPLALFAAVCSRSATIPCDTLSLLPVAVTDIHTPFMPVGHHGLPSPLPNFSTACSFLFLDSSTLYS